MSEYQLSDFKQPGAKTKTINDDVDRQQLDIQQPEVIIVGTGLVMGPDGRPIDTYRLVFFILILHGIGTLMPWNMFINAEAYFRNYKLGPLTNSSTIAVGQTSLDISVDELGNLRKNFISYLSLASQVPNVIFNGLNLIINMGSGNLKLRVNLSLAVEAFIFTLTIVLAMLDSSHWPGAFFRLTMISVVVLNMASGVYQNCVFGIGAKFPGTYTNAILIGSNTSGTFTSIVNLLAIWLAPQPQEAAIYYFITALLIIFVCIISYNLLPMNPFFRYHDESSDKKDELEIGCTQTTTIIEHTTNNDNNNNNDIPETLRKTVDAMVPKPNKDAVTFLGELDKKWQVFKKCWPQCLNVFFTFYVTLALFPAVLANIEQLQDYFDKYFTPFACFLIFNLFAMIGNLISGWTTWPGKDRVWILVVARLIFVPFFLFCNFNPQTRHWPVLIRSDTIFILGNVLLALSSGYLSSLCMMFASSNLDPDEAPKAGMLAAFFLVFGIFLGINSSFFLTWIVELGK